RVYLPDAQHAYGMYIKGEGSAYTLWVNGRLLAQNGVVSTTSTTMMPEKAPLTTFFEPEGEVVELVIQISNFNHRKAGFRNSILLGLPEPVHRFQLQNWFIETFSFSILFVMGLYHLFIYISRTKNKAPLYFALLCWATMIRLGVTNQRILVYYFPNISWALAMRLEYLAFFLVPLLFVLFLRSLYPEDIHRWFVWIVLATGIGFVLYMLFVDTLTLSYLSDYYQIVFISEIVYYLYFLGRILVKRRTGSLYIGFASLIVFAAIVIETLILRGVIGAISLSNYLLIGQVSSFSFLAFIFFQAILLASLFSRSFDRVEALSGELEQSEKKYRMLFEDSKDMIFIAGLDGQIEDVSPACKDVLGYAKPELVEKTIYDVIVAPEDVARFRTAIQDQGSVLNFETELRRKDNRVIHILVSAAPHMDENGDVSGVQGSVRDITARKQAEVERLRALKLEQI
ncbi:MAG: PAS domain S-box protein, partial [Anaerolineales bacterium]